MILTPAEFVTLRAHMETAAPEEACGVLLTRDDARHVQTCRNDAVHMLATDACSSYAMHVEDLARIARHLDEGWTLAAIYHSHTQGTADHLSEGDLRAVMGAIEPHYPDALQIVGRVEQDRLVAMSAYRWNGERYVRVGCCVVRDGEPVQPKALPLVGE